MLLSRKLLSIVIALFISLGIIKSWNYFHTATATQIEISSAHRNFYSNFESSSAARQDLFNALNNNQLVMLGSSELTNQQFASIPNRFFNEQLNIPMLSFGHAGNQSFNYACEIAALKEKKSSSSKIVFIISPGWFAGESGKGTSISSFLEFVDDGMLNKIMHDDSISENFKNSVLNFISSNFENIYYPTPCIKYLFYQKLQMQSLIDKTLYAPSALLYRVWAQFSKTKPTRFSLPNIYTLKSKYESLVPQPEWDSLLQSGLQNEKNKCSNVFGVNDDYYKKYVIGNLPKMMYTPTIPNQELNDLKLLVQLCKDENIDALFIIQALNPYAYSNLEELNPMMNEVKKTIADEGFQVFNLWQPAKEKYQKGLLTDLMHTGEYGWYLIDREIYNHYFQKK